MLVLIFAKELKINFISKILHRAFTFATEKLNYGNILISQVGREIL